GNREAVRLSGINIEKLEIKAYVINGALAAIGAIILVGRLNAAQPIAGNGYELDAIAATVIGGTSLMGGVGSVVSTSIGALIMGVLQNGLTLLNVTSYLQRLIIGFSDYFSGIFRSITSWRSINTPFETVIFRE
ncbi:RbsC, partial [Pasteurella multocida subsp. multocida str. Anand1_buffalo]